MTVSDVVRKTGLARETINSVLDGNYENPKVMSLRKIEAAIPNIRLVVRYEVVLPAENSHAAEGAGEVRS